MKSPAFKWGEGGSKGRSGHFAERGDLSLVGGKGLKLEPSPRSRGSLWRARESEM